MGQQKRAQPGQVDPRAARPHQGARTMPEAQFPPAHRALSPALAAVFGATLLVVSPAPAEQPDPADLSAYQYEETRDLVAMVEQAAQLLHEKGAAAFPDFRKEGGQWRGRPGQAICLHPREKASASRRYWVAKLQICGGDVCLPGVVYAAAEGPIFGEGSRKAFNPFEKYP